LVVIKKNKTKKTKTKQKKTKSKQDQNKILKNNMGEYPLTRGEKNLIASQ